MAKIGLNAKLYRRSAGTYASPTWSEITIVSDVTVNPTWEEADASARETRIKQAVKTLLGLEITAKLKNKPGDANYEALMNGVLSDDTIDLLVMDGDKATEGNRGWRLDALVFSANQDQSMSNALFDELTFKPFVEDNLPKAVLVAAGGVLTYSDPGENGGTFS